ncbi:MAG: hypothetical protein LUQ09_06530 [Methanomassiliicoccales archaeon]|nr:hypothetical protein [Methanomassiliicoccales archaeon]
MDRALDHHVKAWTTTSLLLLSISLVLICQGDIFFSIGSTSIGAGQMLWLPGLIGSCSCLWLMLTMLGARTNISLTISLAALAGAEACTLLLPTNKIDGLDWNEGYGLVLGISFASIAITAITWTATGVIDPARRNWWSYGVALAATVLVGLALSYFYFGFLQGALATALAAALIWGAAYDKRLDRYGDVKDERGHPIILLTLTFLALPLLILGMPYLLQ